MRHGLAAHHQLSGVGGDRAGHDFDQGGFAGAVLSDERVDFPREEIERHALERPNAGKTLGNSVGVQDLGGAGITCAKIGRASCMERV